jgi:Na+:H+ antiporter, NhaA family
LLPWAAWGVLPIFALANAGVVFRGGELATVIAHPITLGLLLARIAGKPIGILAGAGIGIASGLARRPSQLTWPRLAAAATAAGVPFAVSLFVAQIAYLRPELRHVASGAVLVAAVVTSAIAIFALRVTFRRSTAAG